MKRSLSVLLAAVLVVGVAAPAAVAADGSELTAGVEQDPETGAATVTVTANGTTVANATVNVSVVDPNATYDGAGTHVTDANGTVELPAPNETVTVALNVTHGNDTATTTADLVSLDESLSVDVTQNETTGDATVTVVQYGSAVSNATVNVTVADGNTTYDGTGSYETGSNGTVALPAPNRTANVTVTATAGNLSAQTTAVLEAAPEDGDDGEEARTFGQRVSLFVHSLIGTGTDEPMGQAVSEFVTANNPGADNRPEHAGPDRDDGNETDANETERGPPEHAGDETDANETHANETERGPPEDVGDEDDGNETDDGETERGPPEHAGNETDANETERGPPEHARNDG